VKSVSIMGILNKKTTIPIDLSSIKNPTISVGDMITKGITVNNLSCSNCNTKFNTVQEFLNHLPDCIIVQEMFTCDSCGGHDTHLEHNKKITSLIQCDDCSGFRIIIWNDILTDFDLIPKVKKE
jgi:predicted metal-binding protein